VLSLCTLCLSMRTALCKHTPCSQVYKLHKLGVEEPKVGLQIANGHGSALKQPVQHHLQGDPSKQLAARGAILQELLALSAPLGSDRSDSQGLGVGSPAHQTHVLRLYTAFLVRCAGMLGA
jgi:hypothetical protein